MIPLELLCQCVLYVRDLAVIRIFRWSLGILMKSHRDLIRQLAEQAHLAPDATAGEGQG